MLKCVALNKFLRCLEIFLLTSAIAACGGGGGGGSTSSTSTPVVTTAATTVTVATTTTTSTPASNIVCFYAGNNFQGNSLCVREGYADTTSDWNDVISSVKVKPGFKLDLYDGTGQQGTTVQLTADEANLDNRSFKNIASSFKVSTVTAELSVLTYLKNISGHGILGGILRDHKDLAVETHVMQTAAVPLGFYSADFLFGGQASDAHRAVIMQDIITQARAGVVVHLLYHACSPVKAKTNQDEIGCYWGAGGGVLEKLSDTQWSDLVTDGGTLNQVWKGRLDSIAVHLKTLQSAGVQVLFRPFHEMNQDAFWWGGRRGAQGTSRLFELTREYLEQQHQLNNIIWVWDMQDDLDGAPYSFESYAPRSQYWDVAALDVYGSGYNKIYYDELLRIANGKPIALGESFYLPTPSVLAAQPKWVFFMGWSDPEFLQYNSDDAIRTFYRAALSPDAPH